MKKQFIKPELEVVDMRLEKPIADRICEVCGAQLEQVGDPAWAEATEFNPCIYTPRCPNCDGPVGS